MQRFHFLLPNILGFQDSFAAVVELLNKPVIVKIPARVTRDAECLLRELAIDHTCPLPQFPPHHVWVEPGCKMASEL